MQMAMGMQCMHLSADALNLTGMTGDSHSPKNPIASEKEFLYASC